MVRSASPRPNGRSWRRTSSKAKPKTWSITFTAPTCLRACSSEQPSRPNQRRHATAKRRKWRIIKRAAPRRRRRCTGGTDRRYSYMSSQHQTINRVAPGFAARSTLATAAISNNILQTLACSKTSKGREGQCKQKCTNETAYLWPRSRSLRASFLMSLETMGLGTTRPRARACHLISLLPSMDHLLSSMVLDKAKREELRWVLRADRTTNSWLVTAQSTSGITLTAPWIDEAFLRSKKLREALNVRPLSLGDFWKDCLKN